MESKKQGIESDFRVEGNNKMWMQCFIYEVWMSKNQCTVLVPKEILVVKDDIWFQSFLTSH